MRGFDQIVAEERRVSAQAWLEQDGGPCRVKLCGMYRDEDIAALNAAGPDLCGFVHGFPKSHRNVDRKTLERLIAQVDEHIYRTLVVVDRPWQRVAYDAARLGIDLVQLHGHEDDDYIFCLRSRLRIGVIQAFGIREPADVERALASHADMVLLDAGQGTGTRFDWDLIEGFGVRRTYILAGGLGPDNVASAVRALHPWGVDMSSGIETDRLKDPRKMALAVNAVRSLDP